MINLELQSIFARKLAGFESTNRRTKATQEAILEECQKYADFPLSKSIRRISKAKKLDDWLNKMQLLAYKEIQRLEFALRDYYAEQKGNRDVFGNTLEKGDTVQVIFFDYGKKNNSLFTCELLCDESEEELFFLIHSKKFPISGAHALDIPFWKKDCEQFKNSEN